jgi:hypothetical protein
MCGHHAQFFVPLRALSTPLARECVVPGRNGAGATMFLLRIPVLPIPLLRRRCWSDNESLGEPMSTLRALCVG